MLWFFYRAAYYTLLKMSKLLLTVVGYAQVTVVAEAIQPSDPTCTPPPVSASAHNAAVILQQALQYIPNPATECMLRNMAVRLAGHLSNLVSIHVRGGIWLACESGWNSVMWPFKWNFFSITFAWYCLFIMKFYLLSLRTKSSGVKCACSAR